MTTPDTFLWVYDDTARGLALLRGRKVKRVLKMAGLTEQARWSSAGQGWVIGSSDLADLLALADDIGTPYQIKTVGES